MSSIKDTIRGLSKLMMPEDEIIIVNRRDSVERALDELFASRKESPSPSPNNMIGKSRAVYKDPENPFPCKEKLTLIIE